MIKSFFTKQYKRKRNVAPAGSIALASGSTAPPPAPTTDELELQDILSELETDADALAHLAADGGRTEHDEGVVKTIREQAVAHMASWGVIISESEAKAALKVLPKVCYHMVYYFFISMFRCLACCPCNQDA